MENTRSGIGTDATGTRRSDPYIAPHDLFPPLLHCALPSRRDVCIYQLYPRGMAIAECACFHATPRHMEQKEMVDSRRGLSPTRRTAPMPQSSVVAILR